MKPILLGLALFISGLMLGQAVEQVKAEPECPMPSAWLRQDCSIKINKGLYYERSDCLTNKERRKK